MLYCVLATAVLILLRLLLRILARGKLVTRAAERTRRAAVPTSVSRLRITPLLLLLLAAADGARAAICCGIRIGHLCIALLL